MDHMRISGTEPWSLAKQSIFIKWLKIDVQKVPKYKIKPKAMVKWTHRI